MIEEKIKTIDLRIDDLELFIEKIDTNGEVILNKIKLKYFY